MYEARGAAVGAAAGPAKSPQSAASRCALPGSLCTNLSAKSSSLSNPCAFSKPAVCKNADRCSNVGRASNSSRNQAATLWSETGVTCYRFKSTGGIETSTRSELRIISYTPGGMDSIAKPPRSSVAVMESSDSLCSSWTLKDPSSPSLWDKT
jgi:hypothetical protein